PRSPARPTRFSRPASPAISRSRSTCASWPRRCVRTAPHGSPRRIGRLAPWTALGPSATINACRPHHRTRGDQRDAPGDRNERRGRGRRGAARRVRRLGQGLRRERDDGQGGEPVPDRPARGEVPQGRRHAQPGSDDVALRARRGVQRRPAGADREGPDPALVRDAERGVRAAEPLDRGQPDLQDPHHHERRQGHALLPVPLHRPEEREGDGRRRRRPQRAGDRRQVADRRFGRRTREARLVGSDVDGAAGGAEAPRRRRWTLSGVDGRLARLAAGTPATVRTKLVASFLVIAGLLVLVAVLGLRDLGRANGRVEHLDALQLRASAYQALEAYATDLRQMLGVRAAGQPTETAYTHGETLQGGRQWILSDDDAAFALTQVALASNEAHFGFVPSAADERLLGRIHRDYRIVDRAVAKIRALDTRGVGGYKAYSLLVSATDADDDLADQATDLGERTNNATSLLVQANRRADASSADLFVGVAAASVLLALGLGLVLAVSLIGPIRRTEARLAEIA